MHRRLSIDQIHIPVMLSRFGFSLLLTGMASSDGATVDAIAVTLTQGRLELCPKSSLFRARLLAPKLAEQALGRFNENLDKGFAIAVTFSDDERLHPGIASLDATVSWTDGFKGSSRLATVLLQPIKPLEFASPIGP